MDANKNKSIINYLRGNGRMTLSECSNKVKIPLSTVWEIINSKKQNLIQRFTVLLNFRSINYFQIIGFLKLNNDNKQQCLSFLENSEYINNIWKTNNGWDLCFEGIYKDMQESEKFKEEIESKFNAKTQFLYVTEEIVREKYLFNAKTNI